MNKDLMVTPLLGEQLKELWYCDSEKQACELWEYWWEQAQESGIRPLMEFARKLKPYLHGIIASAKFALNTCTLEGSNNKIKLIERMGYGYIGIQITQLTRRHYFLAVYHDCGAL